MQPRAERPTEPPWSPPAATAHTLAGARHSAKLSGALYPAASLQHSSSASACGQELGLLQRVAQMFPCMDKHGRGCKPRGPQPPLGAGSPVRGNTAQRRLLKPMCLEPVLHDTRGPNLESSTHSPQLYKAHRQQQRPSTSKNKENKEPAREPRVRYSCFLLLPSNGWLSSQGV